MADMFSDEWMKSFAEQWNGEAELAGALEQIGFNSTIGYGFAGDDAPAGVLVVENGKATSAGAYNGEELNWDLRASADNWAKWAAKGVGMMGLGTACVIVMDEQTDMVAVARNIARFFAHESCGQCTPCREGSGWVHQMLGRVERGEATTKHLDLLDEVAGSMGMMPGTTICGLADGTNWAVRTILQKFRGEFEARCKPAAVAVRAPAAS